MVKKRALQADMNRIKSAGLARIPDRIGEILGALGQTQDLQRQTLELVQSILRAREQEQKHIVVRVHPTGAHFASMMPNGNMKWTTDPLRATRFRDPQSIQIMVERRAHRFPDCTFTTLRVF